MSHTLARRAATTLAAAALAVTGVLTTAPSASAAPADRSVDWLAGQLDGGLMYNAQFDFNDYGLTADAGYALIEVGGQGRKVQQVRRALADDVNSWTTGVDFGSDAVFAGSVAKALVFAAEAPRARPRSFGGVDLVERMESQVSTDVGTAGRVAGTNTIGQAFAARGLTVTGADRAPAVTAYLLQQQCREGYFRLGFSEADAPAQGCEASGGEADFDATALAVLNLQAVPAPSPTVRAAVDTALDWMVAQQRRNGSFGGGAATESSNTNSTGLAAWALGQDRRCRPAAQAASWVEGLRLDNGAIAYDRPALRSARDGGITTRTRDQFRRATSQAAPGLEYRRVRTCRA